MMRKSKILVYLAVLIPIIILLGMTVLPMMTYFFGEEILLETQPVDPRDIFRGDYVSLRFVINQVDRDLFPKELWDKDTYQKYRHKALYAILKKEGDYYTVERISFEEPNHPFYLDAKVKLYTSLHDYYREEVFVEYPIDRYFVPENTGKDLEELSRKGQLAARIKVWRGYSLLMEIFPKES